jgi:hypothetical protein
MIGFASDANGTGPAEDDPEESAVLLKCIPGAIPAHAASKGKIANAIYGLQRPHNDSCISPLRPELVFVDYVRTRVVF